MHLRKLSIGFFTLGLVWGLGGASAWATTTSPLVSQEYYSVGWGDIETTFSVDTAIIRGAIKNETFGAAFGANYFINDWLAPGLLFEVEHDGGTSARFLPNVKAYWPGLGRVLPYFQMAFGYARFPGTNLFDLGFGPGINYLLSRTVAIGIQFRYDLGVGNGTVHVIQFPVQFAIYFRFH